MGNLVGRAERARPAGKKVSDRGSDNAETTSLGDIIIEYFRFKGHIGIFVEPEGPKWNISPQHDPKWNTGIRSRGQIGIRRDKMEYLGSKGQNGISPFFLKRQVVQVLSQIMGELRIIRVR
jgi:hypothetical protein